MRAASLEVFRSVAAHSHSRSTATRTVSARFLSRVFPIALDRRSFTVPVDKCTIRAMSAIDPPARAAASTSASLSVSGE